MGLLFLKMIISFDKLSIHYMEVCLLEYQFHEIHHWCMIVNPIHHIHPPFHSLLHYTQTNLYLKTTSVSQWDQANFYLITKCKTRENQVWWRSPLVRFLTKNTGPCGILQYISSFTAFFPMFWPMQGYTCTILSFNSQLVEKGHVCIHKS